MAVVVGVVIGDARGAGMESRRQILARYDLADRAFTTRAGQEDGACLRTMRSRRSSPGT